MTTTISAWGNSQGLRFPKNLLKELHLSIGDKLKILVEDNKIILEPQKKERVKYNIDDLVAQIPQDYKASEVFEKREGKEEW